MNPFYRGKSPSHLMAKKRVEILVRFISQTIAFERKSMGDGVSDA